MATTEFPNSYKDPLYASLDAQTEKKLDLPPGLLSSIRLNGERSNHDQSPSDTKAKTVYQFTPTTRDLILKKYNIDPYLSPETASEAAGLLLKEGLDRNKGNVAQAVGEYIGGTDRKNWGKTTNAYIGRVVNAPDFRAATAQAQDQAVAANTKPWEGPSTYDQLVSSMGGTKPAENAMANMVAAYQSGKMTPEDAKAFESQVQAGKIVLPGNVQVGSYQQNFGNRPDGTPKGSGFLGVLKRPDGDVSTEVSIGVNIGGKEMDIPTLVPTLTKDEINQVLSLKPNERMPESIVQKAVDYAKGRLSSGKSVFANPQESPGYRAPADDKVLPKGVADAYRSNKMPTADKQAVESLLRQGYRLPGEIPVGQNEGAGPGYVPTTPNDATVGQNIVGAGETALSVGTGLVGAPVGAVYGAAKGLLDPRVTNIQQLEQAAGQGAANLTYAPRTAAGQAQTAAVGEAMQNAVPVMALTPQLGQLGQAAQLAKPTVQAIPAIARNVAGQAMQEVANRVPAPIAAIPSAVASGVRKAGVATGLLDENAAAARPAATPGTAGSAGAAATDVALQRRTTASDLPVPIDISEGQATRNLGQQRFEGETAKAPGAAGEMLREFGAEQNQRAIKNFDAMIDQTGAEAPTNIETGRVVNDALVKDAAKAKTEYRVKYKEAEKAGEMQEPVQTNSLAQVLNDSASAESTAPVLGAAKKELQRLGGATLDENGNVVPGSLTLNDMEQLRKFVNKTTGADPTNQKFAVDIKRAIDAATEGKGGQLYKDARAARQRYAQLYEDNAVVADLLKSRRGTADRQVALEDIFKRTILDGSREDLSKLRRTLQVGKSEEGLQAWRELQGATLRHLADEATKSVATDTRGNPIVSASGLDKAVKSLEKGEKLQFILGKEGAQKVNDLRDVVQVIKTFPPGTLNNSNTASVILTALAEAGTTGAFTGVPVPVLSLLKAGAQHLKNRRLETRVAAALAQSKPQPIKGLP